MRTSTRSLKDLTVPDAPVVPGRRSSQPTAGAASSIGREELSLRRPNTTAVGEAEAKPLLEAGEAHLRAGDFAAAERAFREAVSAAPDSATAHSKLGVALAQQRQLDAAIAEFSRAVALQPSYAPAYSNLGNAYREKGMTEEAIAAYERAVAIDPDYWIAHQNLGALYKQIGRVADAVEHFKKATRLSVRQPMVGESSRRRRLGCLPALVVVAALLVTLGSLVAAARQGNSAPRGIVSAQCPVRRAN